MTDLEVAGTDRALAALAALRRFNSDGAEGVSAGGASAGGASAGGASAEQVSELLDAIRDIR